METSGRRKFIRSFLAGGGGVAALGMGNLNASPLACSGPYFNVCDYGAVGDGLSDDTSAIQSAIDAAGVSGGIVLVPGGQYKISGSLVFDKNGVRLQGGGCRSTLLISAAAGIDAIRIIDCLNVTIEGIGIYSAVPWSSGRGIRCIRSGLVRITETYIENQFICMSMDSSMVTIRDGYWSPSPNGTAVIVGETLTNPESTEVHIDNLVVDWAYHVTPSHSGYGLRIRHASGVWVSNSDFIHCEYGLCIDPPSGFYVNFCFFSDCAWDSCSIRCIVIGPNTGGFASSLFFSNCWSASCEYDTCYVGGPVDGIQFTNHRFYNSQIGNGIFVHGTATNVMIDSSFASGCAAGTGYVFHDGLSKFALRNSLSGPSGGPSLATFPPNLSGAYIGTGCSNFIISGNILNGNTISSITDSSIGVKVIANNLL